MDQVIFPAAQGPVVGLSLSAIAIRRQKHVCAYCHLGLQEEFDVERGEGKTWKYIQKPPEKQNRKNIIFVVFCLRLFENKNMKGQLVLSSPTW